MYKSTGLFCLVVLCSWSSAWAEKNAVLTAKITKLDSPAMAVTFDDSANRELEKSPDAVWAPAKGKWSIVDGTLVGQELAADKHAAVLNYQKPNRNSVVRFSFKVEGQTTGFNFSLNHAKGHLFRINVTPAMLTVNLDKDKNDPDSKAEILGSAKAKLESGQWYTMQVEMLGERVVAQVDNGASVAVSHKSLDVDKPNYRFVMRGDSLSIDDLQIWELK